MFRREFLQKSIGGSAGLAVSSRALLHASSLMEGTVREAASTHAGSVQNASCKGANDKIVLALVGTGDRGMDTIVSCCKVNDNVTVKTVCDVNSSKLIMYTRKCIMIG